MQNALVYPRLPEDLDADTEAVAERFPWQRVVLPRAVIANALTRPLLRGLLPTDIGCFTRATRHHCVRERGAGQAIFAYCVAGRGWYEIEGKRLGVRAGDLLVLRPGAPHAYAADPREPWTIHGLHATGVHLLDFLVELDVGQDAVVLQLGHDEALIALFQEVLDVVEMGRTDTHLLQASQALGHLMSLLVASRRRTVGSEPDTAQQVAATLKFMSRHIDQALTLQALASQARLSQSHYSALFKRQTGFAPMEYFTRLRMQRAGQALESTSRSIKAIAGMFGYNDLLYFSRVFRQVHGLSPTQYRVSRLEPGS